MGALIRLSEHFAKRAARPALPEGHSADILPYRHRRETVSDNPALAIMERSLAEQLVAEQSGMYVIRELNPGDFRNMGEAEAFRVLDLRERGWVILEARPDTYHNACVWFNRSMPEKLAI